MKKKESVSNDTCEFCHRGRKKTFLNLGLQPNGNQLLTRVNTEVPLKDLQFKYCDYCYSISQDYTLSESNMYEDHPYLTHHNSQYLRELESFVELVEKHCSINPKDLVVDVGCNDGSLLKIFKLKGYKVLGVDPSIIARKYSQLSEVSVIREFWSKELAKNLKDRGIAPRVITSTASFYHMNDIEDWFQGIDEILRVGDFFTVQFVYSKNILEIGSIDQFYHEHTYLHNLTCITKLCERFNFQPIFVSKNDSQGGSLMLIFQKKLKLSTYSLDIRKILNEEKDFFNEKIFREFILKIDTMRKVWLNISNKLLSCEEKIIGISASLRGISFINFLNIPGNIFLGLSEINEEKIGKFTPGQKIPIINETIDQNSTKYYLVLAWTQKSSLLIKYRKEIQKGKSFIIPLPHLEILGSDPLDLKSL